METGEGRDALRRRRARFAVAVTALLALGFAAGVFLAPVLDRAGSLWGGALRIFYAPACHQMIERSLTLGGHPLAVCARCTGLYLGGVAGLVAAVGFLAGARRCPRPFWLAAALAPTVVDGLLPWLGLPQLPVLPRLLLALPAGATAAWFLAVGVADLAASTVEPPPFHPLVDHPHPSPVLEEADG